MELSGSWAHATYWPGIQILPERCVSTRWLDLLTLHGFFQPIFYLSTLGDVLMARRISALSHTLLICRAFKALCACYGRKIVSPHSYQKTLFGQMSSRVRSLGYPTVCCQIIYKLSHGFFRFYLKEVIEERLTVTTWDFDPKKLKVHAQYWWRSQRITGFICGYFNFFILSGLSGNFYLPALGDVLDARRMIRSFPDALLICRHSKALCACQCRKLCSTS